MIFLLPSVDVIAEEVPRRCSVKKVLLKISQNSQENTCTRASFFSKVADLRHESKLLPFFPLIYFLSRSESHIADDFCQIKLFPVLFQKTVIFIWIVFKMKNTCFFEKQADLYQAVVFHVNDYKNCVNSKILFVLTIFRISLFGAVQGWGPPP